MNHTIGPRLAPKAVAGSGSRVSSAIPSQRPSGALVWSDDSVRASWGWLHEGGEQNLDLPPLSYASRQRRARVIARSAESRRNYLIGTEPRLWIDDSCFVAWVCRSRLHRRSETQARAGVNVDRCAGQCGLYSYRSGYARNARGNSWIEKNARKSGTLTNFM